MDLYGKESRSNGYGRLFALQVRVLHTALRSNYAVCQQMIYVLAENLETAQKRKGGGLRKQRTSEVRHEADCQRSLKIVGGLWEHIEKPYVRVVRERS